MKQGILLGFRFGDVIDVSADHGRWPFFDKDTLPLRKFTVADNVRVVPGGSTVRDGAYVAPGGVRTLAVDAADACPAVLPADAPADVRQALLAD